MRYVAVIRAVLVLGCLSAVGGCSFLTGEKKAPPPPPIEYTERSPYRETRTLAVAPAINLSGSRDFDPYAVSDALFSELQQVAGLNVLPLNKTLMAMRRLGIRTIDHPAEARQLAAFLGADGLVVPAVTAYDPFNPPAMGLTLQMYLPAPPPAQGEKADPALDKPVSQASAVFNATNQSVLRELRDFARGRTQYDSALEEQKFLMDSDLYVRFVCHAMVRRLMEVERARVAGR